jgi:hypothetical protein
LLIYFKLKKNYQRASFAEFSDRVETDGHDLGRVSFGDKVVDDRAKHRLDRVRRNQLVSGLIKIKQNRNLVITT